MAITPQAGYIVDPNNPNAVIKAPSTTAMPGSVQAIQQPQPSIAFGAVNTGPIPVSTLTSTAQPYIPPKAPPLPQLGPTVSGAITGATTPPPVTTPTPAPTETMSFSERLKTMLGGDVNTFLSKPTSLADQRTSLRGEYDIAGKEKVVNDLTAQLASITAKYQTAPLILEREGQGRVTTDILNRQQAQAQRDYAIEALPVTAALNAAQGRLDSANKNITELLGVIKEDQDTTYKYQKDVLARAIDIASEDQKRELEAKSAQLDAAKDQQTQFNSLKEGFIQEATNAGDYSIAGRIATAKTIEEVQQLFSAVTAKIATPKIIGSASTGYFKVNADGSTTPISTPPPTTITPKSVIPTASVTALKNALNASKFAGPEADGKYADPTLYLQNYQDWTNKGGSAETFFKAFPPATYINPENTWLPPEIMKFVPKPKASTTSGIPNPFK